MKKKMVSFVLSIAMVSAMLAGCGSTTSSGTAAADTTAAGSAAASTAADAAAETTTTVASATDFTGEDPQLSKDLKILSIWAEDNDNGVLINDICKAYQEVNPNFTYEYEVVSADDLKQKIATLVASDDLPDMFAYESGAPIVDLIEADKIVDI